MKTMLCIASGAKNGGVYQTHITGQCEPGPLHFLGLGSVRHMAQRDRHVYTVLDRPFTDSPNSGLAVLTVKDGELCQAGPILSTAGMGACHVAVCNRRAAAYVANAQSKGISRMMDARVQQFFHNGNHTNIRHRCEPFPCHVSFLFDGQTVCVTDKGMDSLMLYTPELHFMQHIQLPKNSGPRQLVVSEDGRYAYVIHETDASVTVLRCENSHVTVLKTYGVVLSDHGRDPGIRTTAACLTDDGRWLLVAGRGHDSISCFSVGDGSLRLADVVPCGGRGPAAVCMAAGQRYLVCANEESGNVTCMAFGQGALGPARVLAEVDCPVSVMEVHDV